MTAAATAPIELIAAGLPVAPILAEIAANPGEWSRHTLRQDYPGSAHADTRAIFLRWAPEWTPESIFDSTDSVDYPAASVFAETMRIVGRCALLAGATEIGRVMLVGLRPGGVVTPHTDEGRYADHFDRFHLAVQSDWSSVLWVGKEWAMALPGELFWFDHKLKHHASNDSDAERIHLIMDFVTPYRSRRKGA